MVLAKGAGAGSRHSIGVSVFGGMIAVAFFGSILVPAFFVLLNTIKDDPDKRKVLLKELGILLIAIILIYTILFMLIPFIFNALVTFFTGLSLIFKILLAVLALGLLIFGIKKYLQNK